VLRKWWRHARKWIKGRQAHKEQGVHSEGHLTVKIYTGVTPPTILSKTSRKVPIFHIACKKLDHSQGSSDWCQLMELFKKWFFHLGLVFQCCKCLVLLCELCEHLHGHHKLHAGTYYEEDYTFVADHMITTQGFRCNTTFNWSSELSGLIEGLNPPIQSLTCLIDGYPIWCVLHLAHGWSHLLHGSVRDLPNLMPQTKPQGWYNCPSGDGEFKYKWYLLASKVVSHFNVQFLDQSNMHALLTDLTLHDTQPDVPKLLQYLHISPVEYISNVGHLLKCIQWSNVSLRILSVMNQSKIMR
jgi:hypothetical protein